MSAKTVEQALRDEILCLNGEIGKLEGKIREQKFALQASENELFCKNALLGGLQNALAAQLTEPLKPF